MNNKQQKELKNFIILDNDYDQYAQQLALFNMKVEKFELGLEQLRDVYKARLKQLRLYICNAIWDKYDETKYSFITDDFSSNEYNTVYFYPQKDFISANIALQEHKITTMDVVEEVKKCNSYSLDVDKEDYKSTIQFLLRYLKKPLCQFKILKEQHKQLDKLIMANDNAKSDEQMLLDELNQAKSDYNDVMNDAIEELVADDYYDFDPDENDILIMQEKITKKWKLAIQ